MTISKNVWKIAGLLLVLCLISATMISGTFAKYTSTYAGKDTALVARWDIVATGGGVTLNGDGSADLDLFSHTLNGVQGKVGDDYIIAPGVGGSFVIQLANDSDVKAAVEFEIATLPGSVDVPVKYGFASDAINLDINGLLTELNGAGSDFAEIDFAGNATETIFWEWPYYESDEADEIDTGFGETSASGENRSTYGLVITASAIQLEPGTL